MATSNPFGDPQTQALLGLAQGLLQAGSPQPFPTNVSGALAQGVGGALSGAMNAQRYNYLQQQSEAARLQNELLSGKINFLNGMPLNGGASPSPSAAGGTAAPASPVISNPGANFAYGAPLSGAPQAQPAPSGFPQVPGLNDVMSRAAAIGYLSPQYVSSVASANAPTDFQKIERAAAAGDPAAKAWLSKQMTMVNRGYGVGQIGPNGEYVPDLASEGQIARTTAAKAAAEAAQRTVEVTTPDGRKVRVPESAITGGAAPTQGQAPTPHAAVQQGITPAEAEAQRANEESLAKEASKGREASNLAVDTNYNLQRVIEASHGFETGQFAPTVNGARAFLQGLAPGLFPDSEMKKLTSFQEFNKYSIRLGFDQARKMGARESTQIVQMSIESNPNPKMVKPAINAIANGLMAQNDYVIAKEKARDAYFAQNKKLGGFNSYWQSLADPRAFLLARQDPASQAKLIEALSPADRKKLADSLTALRKAGAL